MKKRFVLVLGLVLGSNVYAIDKDKVNKILAFECEMPADQQVRHETYIENAKHNDEYYNSEIDGYRSQKNEWRYIKYETKCNLMLKAYDEIVFEYRAPEGGLDELYLMEKVRERYKRFLNDNNINDFRYLR